MAQGSLERMLGIKLPAPVSGCSKVERRLVAKKIMIFFVEIMVIWITVKCAQLRIRTSKRNNKWKQDETQKSVLQETRIATNKLIKRNLHFNQNSSMREAKQQNESAEILAVSAWVHPNK